MQFVGNQSPNSVPSGTAPVLIMPSLSQSQLQRYRVNRFPFVSWYKFWQRRLFLAHPQSQHYTFLSAVRRAASPNSRSILKAKDAWKVNLYNSIRFPLKNYRETVAWKRFRLPLALQIVFIYEVTLSRWVLSQRYILIGQRGVLDDMCEITESWRPIFQFKVLNKRWLIWKTETLYKHLNRSKNQTY